MSFFDKIFGNGGTPAPQQQAPTQQAPTNNPAQNQPPAQPASSAVTAPNGTVPADGAQPGTQSPPDKFAKLWEPNEPDKTKQGEQTPAALTAEKIAEAASKVDFRKNLNPELITKLQSGGQEAVAATIDLMNQTAQQVYTQSVVVSQKLVERAIEQAREQFASEVPNLVKGQAAREALLADNPAFKDPRVSPIVGAVQQQLQQKFPQASAAEISQMAREYFKDAASVFASDPKAAAASAAASQTGKSGGNESWDEWFQLPTPSLPSKS